MRTPAGSRLWYLSAINHLAAAGVDVRVLSIEGLQWGELDYPADLVRARKLAAAWVAREQASAARAEAGSGA
jgi:choline kinase